MWLSNTVLRWLMFVSIALLVNCGPQSKFQVGGKGPKILDGGVKDFPELCLKSATNKANLIYLHGWLGVNSDVYDLFESTNRETLKSISQECKINISLPRTLRQGQCTGPGVYCWNLNLVDRVERVLPDVLERASHCLNRTEKKALIGFSDGGYFVSHVSNSNLYNQEVSNEIPWLAIIGAPRATPGDYEVLPEMSGLHAIDKQSLIAYLTRKGLCFR